MIWVLGVAGEAVTVSTEEAKAIMYHVNRMLGQPAKGIMRHLYPILDTLKVGGVQVRVQNPLRPHSTLSSSLLIYLTPDTAAHS